MTPQYFAASSVYTDQLVPGKGALLQTFSTWHPNTNLNTQIQIKNLTPTLERRCNFSRRDWELFFLLSPGETRSRLSYDHSRISRRERDSILLLSCFDTRSRLQKIISRGRARKMKLTLVQNSRDREFSLTSALYDQFYWKASSVRLFDFFELKMRIRKKEIYQSCVSFVVGRIKRIESDAFVVAASLH